MITLSGSGCLFSEVLHARLSRRDALKIGSGLLLTLPFGAGLRAASQPGEPLLGFRPLPPSTVDGLFVPEGYQARVLYAWGDPAGLSAGLPAFRFDGQGSAAEQALQAGMHHDGMEFFPLPARGNGSEHGLLAINHEYTDERLLQAPGEWSVEKTLKSQYAHGVSVIEVRRGSEWQVVRPSRYARRITARTPMRLSGPAAGHALLRTAADPTGTMVLGTYNNCAAGRTLWGTCLTCEENFNVYFANAGAVPPDHARYGIAGKAVVPWHLNDQRFDVQRHPNEPNRFGWVVEIDPYDPQSRPIKRTALGRIKHEGATCTLSAEGHAVIYMGDDEGFERIYKFVSRDRYEPANRKGKLDLLDHGTLYVARFDADGTGQWLPMVQGEGPLTAANGFSSQAEVLVRTRQAADALGGTRMDRPEWIAVHPASGEVYCTLTNNSARGLPGWPGTDAANPRARNLFGHIIRWRESRGDAASASFDWDIFVLAGNPIHPEAAQRGNVKGNAFGSPDGLRFDQRGVLWIQTDASTPLMQSADYRGIGNNQMLAADPATGEIRRFLVGPPGSEVTGNTMTPDGRTLFINIQHPGEGTSSRWPDFRPDGKPRSATVAIRRVDNGLIGT